MNKTASLKGHAFKVSTLILALLVGGALLLTGCPPGIEPGADGDTYIVTINTGANGALTVVANLTPINSGDEAAAGSIISLSAVPSNGYELDTLSYNDGADHPLTTEFTGVNYLAAFTMPANAVTITATFKQPDANSHSITITAPANGTITASAGSAASGATITLTITPASGYEPDAITWNDGSNHTITELTAVGEGYTSSFTMPDRAVTVSGTFKLIPSGSHSITIGTVINGTIAPNVLSAAQGATITLTITPTSGYEPDTITWNDGRNNHTVTELTAVGEGYTGSFTMPNTDVTVSGTFRQIQASAHSITIGTFTNGTITASAGSAFSGTPITLTIAPNNGYQLKAGTLKYNATAITSINGNSATFTMPNDNVTITAEFETISAHTVTVTQPANGTISASPNSAAAGTLITLTFVPNAGYEPDAFTWNDGESHPLFPTLIGGVYTAYLQMPAHAVTVTGAFKALPANTYPITVASAVTNGAITPNVVSAAQGATVNLTIAPATGYRLQTGTLQFNGTVITPTGNTASFTMPDAAVTITAVFEPIPTNAVTITQAAGGTISASPNPAVAGATVTLTITPNATFTPTLSAFKWNDGADHPFTPTPNGSTYTAAFTMPGREVTVTGAFEAIPPSNFSITIGVFAHGSVTTVPPGTAYAAGGATINLVIAPETGYRLKAGTLKFNDTAIIPTGTTASFTMPAAAVTIAAEFEAIPTYAITRVVLPGYEAGSIETRVNGTYASSAAEGATVTVQTYTNGGYTLQSLTLTGVGGTPQPILGSTFVMPTGPATVTATFVQATYSITGSAAHGTITANPVSAPKNTPVTLNIVAAPGYTLKPDTLKYSWYYGYESEDLIPTSGADPQHFTASFITPGSEWGSGFDVTVSAEFVPLVSSITIPGPIELSVGGTYQLTANVLPADAFNKTLTWSSNSAAVTVNPLTGLVNAVSAGTAIITATAQDGSGKTGTVTVTVKAGNGITINFSGFGDETIDLNLTDNQGNPGKVVLSKSTHDQLTITITSSYSSIEGWYDNGSPNNNYWYSDYAEIYADWLPLGSHTVSVIVVAENGIPYSKIVKFTVVE